MTFEIGSISAQIDGKCPYIILLRLNIRDQETGFAVGLGDQAIQAGQSGTVLHKDWHFE